MIDEIDDTLNILRVSSSLYPDKLGGIGLHVHTMSQRQGEAGHTVTVLTSDLGSDRPTYEPREGYDVIRHREIIRLLGNSITPGIVPKLWNSLEDYDILHVHSHLFFTSNMAAFVRRLQSTDIPMVLTNHGVAVDEGPFLLTDVYLPTLGKFTFNSADLISCYTETDKTLLEKIGVSTDITVIPNGIDVQQFRPLEHVRTDPNRIVYVGMLKRKKGVHHLLRAFKILEEEHSDLELRIIGDGTYAPELHALRDELELKNVSFVGRVENEDLPEIYNGAAVSVLPSESEGLPRVVIEAMACGTPVVTTDLPQLDGVIKEAGVSVPYGEADQLAEAILSLLKTEKLEEMGKVGRQRIVEEYSWDETVRQTTEHYYELLT